MGLLKRDGGERGNKEKAGHPKKAVKEGGKAAPKKKAWEK